MFRGFHRLIRIRREHGESHIQNDMNFPASSRGEHGYTYIIEDAPSEDASSEGASAEGALAEEAPAKEAPAKEAPAKEAPAEEVYAENARTEADVLEHELCGVSNSALDEVCETLDGVNLDRGQERENKPKNPRVAKYGTDIITLLVGTNRTPFHVHQGFLEESRFFQACCNRGFREMKEKLVRLPEGDPSDFAYLVDFLYAGSIPWHNYAGNPISDLDVFTDQKLWYSTSWCPDQRYYHLWYPSSEHISPIFRCTMFEEDWDEESWEKSDEKKFADEAKAHLDFLLRLYELADQYLFDGFREHIIEHILHAANYCEPYDYFDAASTLYDYPTELPARFKEGIRRYIEFYIKATDRDTTVELMEAMADNSRLAGEIIEVMSRLLEELNRFLEAASRIEKPWSLYPLQAFH
ncbi:hypothetical protein DTO271G3_241 [Paecilomyces variotii]|nr:hypothetical protein DTO271G3_241 [Paecilomyces variotii]